MANSSIAVVTGANRGIGFEVCRQLAQRGVNVVLTARAAPLGLAASAQLNREGLPVEFHELEVTDDASIKMLKEHLEKKFGLINVLVNNAGTGVSGDGAALEVDLAVIRKALEVNCFGSLRIIQALIPLLKKSPNARIVNVSSGMGAFSTMKGGLAAYRLSKTCLNAVTTMVASELADTGIAVNAVCPGWVKTRMGGQTAPRSVEEGADTIVWAALDVPSTLSGKFLRDREVIPW